MGFQLQVINSCTIVSASGTSYGSSTGIITFTDLDSGTTYTQGITWSGAGGSGQTNVLVSNLPASNGVYEVSLSEGGVEVARRALLLSCDIDCCLTKLTNELIDCACDCARCSVALLKAQKIFLLLKSAKSTVELTYTVAGSTNNGYYQDIVDKYKKARELCDNSCGCDC